MTVKDVLALKVVKTAMQGYVIVTIFHANKAYDMDDKLLNCKVEDWELEWNTLLVICESVLLMGCTSTVETVSSNTTTGNAESRCDLSGADAEFFITVAERADNNARKLNQCIDAYNALRKGD